MGKHADQATVLTDNREAVEEQLVLLAKRPWMLFSDWD